MSFHNHKVSLFKPSGLRLLKVRKNVNRQSHFLRIYCSLLKPGYLYYIARCRCCRRRRVSTFSPASDSIVPNDRPLHHPPTLHPIESATPFDFRSSWPYCFGFVDPRRPRHFPSLFWQRRRTKHHITRPRAARNQAVRQRSRRCVAR
jgi:hypothetical protein